MPYIRVYTKEKDSEKYPDGLARSIHFALGDNGRETELNHGYGILFAKGAVRANGTIEPKGVCDPKILRTNDNKFLIKAERVLEDGKKEECPVNVYWLSRNLIDFEEIDENAASKVKLAEAGGAAEDNSNAADIQEADSKVGITSEEASKILDYWNAPAGKELVPFGKGEGLGDPVFFHWDGKWYYLFTNDNLNDIGLYIREGNSIEGLLKDENPMHCILKADEELGFIQTFWAPEFHLIGSELYILFAVSGKEFGPCCHMMKLKKGRKLTEADSYEIPVAVKRRDGSVLTIPEYRLSKEKVESIVPSDERHVDDRYGISIDMTYLKDAGCSYMIWSFRQHIGTALDSGSMLMIAGTSEESPWQLTTEPVLISRPLYGYENACGTINNEGPYVYKHDDMIYVNYSGGDARGYLYIVNLLSARSGSDLLNPVSWKKRVTPICNFTTYPGVYGPGHNSYFTDENGKEWIAFHAVDSFNSRKICVGIFEYPKNL